MRTVFPNPQSRNGSTHPHPSFKRRLQAALIRFSGKAVQLAYSVRSPTKYLQRHQDLVPSSGWQEAYTSAELNSDHYGYQAVVFINHDTREVHIANAGTELQALHDLWDDARLCVDYVPNKLASAQWLLDSLSAQDPEINNYVFSTSGHSLGAIVAELMGAEILSRGWKLGHCITLENPGSALVLKSAIQDQLLTGKATWSVKQLAQHCIVYNASPNFINHLKYQLSEEVNLVILPKEDVAPDRDHTGYSTLYRAVCSSFKNCLNYLGIKKITNTVSDHKLANFLQLEHSIVIPVEGASWRSRELQQLVLKLDSRDPLLEKLILGPSTGKDVVLFFNDPLNEDPLFEDYCFMERQREYSFEDLRTAYLQVKPLLNAQNHIKLTATSIKSDEIDEGFCEGDLPTDLTLTQINLQLLDDDDKDEGFYEDKVDYERYEVVKKGLPQSIVASAFEKKATHYPPLVQPAHLSLLGALVNSA